MEELRASYRAALSFPAGRIETNMCGSQKTQGDLVVCWERKRLHQLITVDVDGSVANNTVDFSVHWRCAAVRRDRVDGGEGKLSAAHADPALTQFLERDYHIGKIVAQGAYQEKIKHNCFSWAIAPSCAEWRLYDETPGRSLLSPGTTVRVSFGAEDKGKDTLVF